MAKVVIVIEDTMPGRFKCEVTPKFSTLIKMHGDDVALSPAQEIAVLAVQTIARASEEGEDSRKKIIDPYGRK